MRESNEPEDTSRRIVRPREAVAIVSLDIEANSLREMIEGLGRAGFKLEIVRALTAEHQKPGSGIELVVLFGEFAKPDNCRKLREYGFEGFILLLCPKGNRLMSEYFDAGADDLIQNFTDGVESIYLRGLVALRSLVSRQSAQTFLMQAIDSRRMLEAILDTQPELIERFDRNGTLTYVNAALCKLLGKSREELLGQSLYSLLPQDLAKELIPKLELCFQTAVPFWNENIVVELNGNIRWFEWHNSPILDMDGQVKEIQSSGRDIHEKKLLLEALCEKAQDQNEKKCGLEQLVILRNAELNKTYQRLHISERFAAMGMIAAQVAHELNGPLAGIRNAFYLIRGTLEPSNKRFEYVVMVEKELDRLAEILKQLYSLYGPQSRVLSKTNLSFILEETRKMMEVIFGGKGAPIEINISEPEILVELPLGPLRQVLYNVIINAVNASPRDVPVTIHAIRKDSVLDLTIHNYGKPIPPEVQATLFEPFSRTSPENFSPGLGLGLYITKCLMIEMGGTIRIESVTGKGTTISLQFTNMYGG